MKPLLITEKGFNGANYSMDEIDIKEEPLQDDLVSEFYYNVFSEFFYHDLNAKFFDLPNYPCCIVGGWMICHFLNI